MSQKSNSALAARVHICGFACPFVYWELYIYKKRLWGLLLYINILASVVGSSGPYVSRTESQ